MLAWRTVALGGDLAVGSLITRAETSSYSSEWLGELFAQLLHSTCARRLHQSTRAQCTLVARDQLCLLVYSSVRSNFDNTVLPATTP